MQYDFNNLYGRELRPSEAFDSGGQETLTSGANYNSRVSDVLGSFTEVWTDPDGNSISTTTRDFVEFAGSFVLMGQTPVDPPFHSAGWLLVSETAAIPEPSGGCVLAVVTLLVMKRRRRNLNTSV